MWCFFFITHTFPTRGLWHVVWGSQKLNHLPSTWQVTALDAPTTLSNTKCQNVVCFGDICEFEPQWITRFTLPSIVKMKTDVTIFGKWSWLVRDVMSLYWQVFRSRCNVGPQAFFRFKVFKAVNSFGFSFPSASLHGSVWFVLSNCIHQQWLSSTSCGQFWESSLKMGLLQCRPWGSSFPVCLFTCRRAWDTAHLCEGEEWDTATGMSYILFMALSLLLGGLILLHLTSTYVHYRHVSSLLLMAKRVFHGWIWTGSKCCSFMQQDIIFRTNIAALMSFKLHWKSQ